MPVDSDCQRSVRVPHERELVRWFLLGDPGARADRERRSWGVLAFVGRQGLNRPLNLRELRNVQRRAVDEAGRPTFPILHRRDESGGRVRVPRGTVPSFHGFRHSAASEAIAAGDSSEEVSWQLGHRNSTVTRTIYVQEIKTAERTARRRARMEERYGAMLGSAMEAADGSRGQQTSADILEIVPGRSAAK